jgi:hypothetical protein
MDQFDPDAYGPVFARLLAIDRRRPLDAGTCDGTFPDELEGFSAEAAFAHAKITDGDMAECCVSGVWLLHDCLEKSHSISQGIDSPSGSFWHAIMHRREGDYSNAKYWFRRVGRHPVLDSIAHVAASLRDADASFGETRLREAWDPFAFVDLCQAVVRGQSSDRELCLDMQQAEWELLFDYCYQQATEH